ncbi:MAG: hypothetical protein JJ900_01170 [Rhodospirillales bacterium]|nr:hypothetical protein [Rhodospirillales bacterium]MBO6785430.1 hypothetical protein [Rhodospirillales bacterium]
MTFAAYALLSLTLLLTGCAQSSGGEPPPGASLSGESAGAPGDMTGIIFVVPLEGAPVRTALVLADAIAAEIRDTNRPAILSHDPNQAGASVVGKIATADTRGNVIWLGIDWAIRAPYGTHVATYRQHVVVDAAMWQRAAPEAINLIIADAAPKVAEMVAAEVGPPMMAAMHHPEISPQETAAPDPAVTGTTMDVRRQQMQTTDAAPSAAPDAAPVPAQPQPQPQPLARIADATNGQVVHAAGAPEAPRETAPPPAPEPATEATSAADAPPDGLPSLLTPVPPQQADGGDAAHVSSGPPQALTPGTRVVSPPPGGVAGNTAETEPEESFLDALNPNLDSKTRLDGDARPNSDGIAFAKVRWGQPSFLIKPVTGAPGNGNEALTAALKSALRDKDLTISEDPRQAGFIIQGNVDTGDPVNGRQYVRIIWRVNTVTGEEVGKAVQENTVVAGSLDGEWGRVAEAVSYAAVRGISDLFSDADAHLTSREPLPDFPDVQLPSVPGRAPPPPASY